MWRSNRLVFRQGFIDVVAWVGLAGAVLACSDDDVVESIPPPSASAGAAGAGGADVGETPDAGEAPDGGVAAEVPEPALPTILADRVGELFERDCVECHGGGMAQAGLGDLPALTTLLSSGQIVPGSSVSSPLMTLFQGEHHVPNAWDWLSVGEVALIARFIDELPVQDDLPCQPHGFVSHDAQLAAMLADASSLSAEALPFTRYLTIAPASNVGACGAALDRDRHALFALINSVSTAPEIHVPAAIDEHGLIYRVDTRDYGWNRPIDLEDDGSVDFDDGWAATTAAAGDYALPFDGPEADELERLTQTRVTHLAVNAFVATASRGNLYYALTNQSSSLGATEAGLGIDIIEAIDSDAVSRSAFESPRSVGGYNDLMALRSPQGGSTSLAYWTLGSFRTDVGESMFSDPLGMDFESSQIIFHLPNGLLAFTAASADATRLDATSANCLECTTPRGSFVAAGCRGCHHTGLLPLEDQVRPFVELNQLQYSRGEFESTLVQYPTPPELDQTLAADTAIYLAALDRAGVPRNVPDPVSAVYFDFEQPLTLARTAAELGVTPGELESRLVDLDGPLQTLSIDEARLARTDLTAVYRSAVCLLLGSAQNRPEGCL